MPIEFFLINTRNSIMILNNNRDIIEIFVDSYVCIYTTCGILRIAMFHYIQ